MGSFSDNSTRPAKGGFEVVQSDTVNLAQIARGIWVGTPGNIHVIMEDNSEVTWPAAVAGVMHPIVCKRVFVTGTTATDIWAGKE